MFRQYIAARSWPPIGVQTIIRVTQALKAKSSQPRSFQPWLAILWALGFALAAGCNEHHESVEPFRYEGPRKVKTAALESIVDNVFAQTGTIRARREIPLAFQVPGRITSRHVDTGMTVRAGDVLLELDRKDFDDQLSAAVAQLRAVEAEARDSERELQRQKQMITTKATSQMALDKALAAVDAVTQRVVATQSQLALAKNSLEYTQLRAPVDGLLVDVFGQAGQVVGVGQEVARLAESGELEVEVALPQSLIGNVPQNGECFLNGGEKRFLIELREVSGSADPMSRTWRARYRVLKPETASLPLGSIVRVRLKLSDVDPYLKRVPIAAIDERGDQPRVWLLEEGKANPHSVEIVEYNGEYCKIRSQLPDGAPVISMGTHLLEKGMFVEAIQQ